MWLVDIVGRNVDGSGLWHYAPQEDDVLLACGIRNPPWYFRWDGQAWQEADSSVTGIAIRKWHDAEALRAFMELPQSRFCTRCRQAAETEIARRNHQALACAMLAEGRPEITVACLVTIRDMDAGKEIRCCFAPVSDLPEDVWMCSPASPLGAALPGRFVGEEVAVELPGGRTRYAILRAEPLRI